MDNFPCECAKGTYELLHEFILAEGEVHTSILIPSRHKRLLAHATETYSFIYLFIYLFDIIACLPRYAIPKFSRVLSLRFYVLSRRTILGSLRRLPITYCAQDQVYAGLGMEPGTPSFDYLFKDLSFWRGWCAQITDFFCINIAPIYSSRSCLSHCVHALSWFCFSRNYLNDNPFCLRCHFLTSCCALSLFRRCRRSNDCFSFAQLFSICIWIHA